MKNILFIGILLTITWSVMGQVNKNGIPFFRNYSSEEYNASEQNWAVVQDNRGVMYFGNNDDGILEYDGTSWKKIKTTPQTIVRSMTIDDLGVIYIGGVGEFGFLAPDETGTLTYYTLSDQLDSLNGQFGNVWKTYFHDNKTYFCTQNDIFIYKDKKFVDQIEFNLKYSFLSFFLNNEIYVGNYLEGLTKVDNDSLIVVKNGDFFHKKNIFYIHPHSDTSFYVFTTFNGIFIYGTESGSISQFKESEKLKEFRKDNRLYCATELYNGNFAIGSLDKGMVIINKKGEIIDMINKHYGIQDETTLYIYQNKLNNSLQPLWVALNEGVYKAQFNSPFRFFTEQYGIKGTINDLTMYNNTMYIGTSSGVFYLTYENQEPIFKQIDPIQSGWSFIKFHIPNSDESILLVGTQEGLYKIDTNNVAHEIEKDIKFKRKVPDTYKFYNIYSLKTSQKDSSLLYIGNMEFTILRYMGNDKWEEEYRIAREKIKDEARSIAEDTNGNVWISTSFNGILRLNPKKDSIRYYGTEDGLPTMNTNFIESYNDTLYFLSTKGLLSYDEKQDKFVQCEKFGKRFNNISFFRMKKGKDNSYWLSLNLEEPYFLKWTEAVYQQNGEMVTDTLPFQILPNLSVDALLPSNNLVWLGNSKGIYSFDRNYQKNYNIEFPALIRKIILGEDSTIFNGTYFEYTENGEKIPSLKQPSELIPELDYKYNNITFYFSSPFFDNEEAIEFSFFLEGNDTKWSKWGKEHYKDFTNLTEGEYVFKVKAKNVYGVESSEASFVFSVLPPWYRTIWAYISYLVVIIVLIIVIVKLYTRKLEREKIRLEGIVKERTAEVVKQKEDIEKKNDILETQKEEIELKNVELEKQKEEITVQRDHIAEINQEMTDSIHYAERIQKAILPHNEHANEILGDHFILFKPKDIVSGDFYWAGKIGDQVLLTAADCTGHGVPGAFMSMLGVAFLNEVVKDKNVTEAGQVLDNLRQHIIRSLQQTGKEGEQKDGMDMSFCAIDMKKNIAQWAGANNPLYIIRRKVSDEDKLVYTIDGKEAEQTPDLSTETHHLFELKPDKMPIAIYLKMDNFRNHVIELQKDDALYMFSDGYADQFGGPKGKKFKYKPFKRLILEGQVKSMPEQMDDLDSAIEKWKAFEDPITGNPTFEQIDDIVVVGIRITK